MQSLTLLKINGGGRVVVSAGRVLWAIVTSAAFAACPRR